MLGLITTHNAAQHRPQRLWYVASEGGLQARLPHAHLALHHQLRSHPPLSYDPSLPPTNIPLVRLLTVFVVALPRGAAKRARRRAKRWRRAFVIVVIVFFFIVVVKRARSGQTARRPRVCDPAVGAIARGLPQSRVRERRGRPTGQLQRRLRPSKPGPSKHHRGSWWRWRSNGRWHLSRVKGSTTLTGPAVVHK
jgi:hypothetical protein